MLARYDIFLLVLLCAILLCAAAVSYFAYLRQANDEMTRYRKQRFIFITWIVLFVTTILNLSRPKVQNIQSIFTPPVHESAFHRLFPLVMCGLYGVGIVILFFALLKARRKLLELPGFKKKVKRLPPLFWQSVFILLPVAGLACFGLYSLRQDRLLAEQEAREVGQSLAERLAQAISDRAVQPLNDYREASFEFDANCLADVGTSDWQGGAKSENQAWHNIQLWQQANPGIDLTSMPSAERGGYEIMMGPTPPEPPEWLLQLNPQQQQLWEQVKESELTVASGASVQSAISKFIKSKPPAAARANAEYLLLLAKTHDLPNTNAAAKFASQWNQSDYLSEAGLPLGQLMCYQALRLTPDGSGVSDEFLKNIFWVIVWKPSFFSERLIAEAVRVAKGTASESKVAELKIWWDREQSALQVFDDFQKQYPENGWNAGAFNVNSHHSQFLLFLGAGLDDPTNQVPPCLYLIIPQPVMENALATAIQQSGISVPPYFQATVQIGSEDIALDKHPNDETVTNAFISPVFGQADGKWQDLWGLNTTQTHFTYPFHVRILLAHPDILYAQQRQRAWMFGGLIVLSAIAAISALLAAYRSFLRQQQLTEMKTNFVSSVSHELRAPIASVRLMAENLERGKIPEASRQNEYFKFIVQECRRLSSLIENVLDFSRIEQGRKQYEFEPSNLVSLAQTTVKLLEPYAAERDVRLETAMPGAESNIELEVDGRAIQQALVNLIDNAIKHSPKGEAVTVGVTRQNDGKVHVFVADRGPGIPPEEHEKIFERFYRRGSELRRETQGVGIGLSVVKHIIEAHGGRIIVESEPGKGTRFTIELQPRNPNE